MCALCLIHVREAAKLPGSGCDRKSVSGMCSLGDLADYHMRSTLYGADGQPERYGYLLSVEVTALMLSSPSVSSPHAQSQSPPQPPGLQSPA